MINRFWIVLGMAALSGAAASSAGAAPRSGGGEIVIINSGDRLTPGYTASVSPTGRLSAVFYPRYRKTPVRRTNQMIEANRQRLFADLARAEPLGRLQTGGGQGFRRGRGRRGGPQAPPAAALSGVQVFVRYGGQQSPDLRAVRSGSGQVLYQDIKQVLQILRLPIPDVP